VLYAACPPGGCSACPHRNQPVVYRLTSRRRGASLGVNLYPGRKVCSFDCIYCFRGPTQLKTTDPVDLGFPTPRDLEAALEAALRDSGEVRSVDFSGNGEPTLHPRLPEFVAVVRRVLSEHSVGASVGVFTNSSTLSDEGVLRALAGVDHVEAKLDTAVEWKFRAINAPHPSVGLGAVLEGLRRLSRARGGALAVQVMLIDAGGVSNCSAEDAELLAEALRAVDPDEVHLHTVYREPRSRGVGKPPRARFEEFAGILRREGFRVSAHYD